MTNILQSTAGNEDIVFEEDAFSGFEGKSIVINEGGGNSDVEAGIQFIYDLREHIVDVSIATVYLLTVFAILMWIKKKFS
jgi:hypothetical protein